MKNRILSDWIARNFAPCKEQNLGASKEWGSGH